MPVDIDLIILIAITITVVGIVLWDMRNDE
jgi:hypothetical protein